MIAHIFFYIISVGATILSGFYIYTEIKNKKKNLK